MAQTFLFYDLETSGLNPASDRIMQFAAQRTTLNLELIGEPINVLVELSDDTLPSPDAIMVTGITPQKTREEGYSEADFAKYLMEEIFTPDTIIVGFNNVRFDDEFLRYLFWRNFYDPYAWSWQDGRSRWDVLDVVRMTRALRPAGIEWPVDEKGDPTNRLEMITKANGIDHDDAHDALGDVTALIKVVSLIKTHQPQLFDYLLKLRDKKKVQQLVNLDDKKPFVYTSGRYDKNFAKSTVTFPLTAAPHSNVLVYDLRYDPLPFVKMSEEELAKKWFATWEERQQADFLPIPVKQLQYNRCPAVAPLGVLEQDNGWQNLDLTEQQITQNLQTLLEYPDFAEKMRSLAERERDFPKSNDPEALLYAGFLSNRDQLRIEAIRNANLQELTDFHPDFEDERLAPLLLHYKARNYPRALTTQEMTGWEEWRTGRLAEAYPSYQKRIAALIKSANAEQQFLLEELLLWAEAIMPFTSD